MHQGGGDEERLSELRLDDLRWAALRRPTAELVAVSGWVRLDRHCFNVIGPLNVELRSCRQRGIDCGMQGPAARIGLVTQRLAAEGRAQVAEEHRCVAPTGLVQLEEAKTAIKDVPRAGEPGLRQHGRENARTCRLARLQPLGQRPVQDALAIAGGVTIGNAKGGQHLLRGQTDQFARSRGGAKDPHRRGAMPAPVERARERDAARYVQTQGDGQQHVTPTDMPEDRIPRERNPAPKRRDGWSPRCPTYRRNPARDPCWHSAAPPVAPAGGCPATAHGFPRARPTGRSPRRARRSLESRCRQACSQTYRGYRDGQM